MKKLMLLLPLLLGLAACEAPDISEKPMEVAMQAGAVYAINQGDRVVPASQDTEISVVHQLSTNSKTVTLLTGSATLIRGNYRLGESNE